MRGRAFQQGVDPGTETLRWCREGGERVEVNLKEVGFGNGVRGRRPAAGRCTACPSAGVGDHLAGFPPGHVVAPSRTTRSSRNRHRPALPRQRPSRHVLPPTGAWCGRSRRQSPRPAHQRYRWTCGHRRTRTGAAASGPGGAGARVRRRSHRRARHNDAARMWTPSRRHCRWHPPARWPPRSARRCCTRCSDGSPAHGRGGGGRRQTPTVGRLRRLRHRDVRGGDTGVHPATHLAVSLGWNGGVDDDLQVCGEPGVVAQGTDLAVTGRDQPAVHDPQPVPGIDGTCGRPEGEEPPKPPSSQPSAAPFRARARLSSSPESTRRAAQRVSGEARGNTRQPVRAASRDPAVRPTSARTASVRGRAKPVRCPRNPAHTLPGHFKIDTWNFPVSAARRESAPRFGHAAPEKVSHSPIDVSMMCEGSERDATIEELIRIPARLPASTVDRINTPAHRPTGSTLTSQ